MSDEALGLFKLSSVKELLFHEVRILIGKF